MGIMLESSSGRESSGEMPVQSHNALGRENLVSFIRASGQIVTIERGRRLILREAVAWLLARESPWVLLANSR
jgi:hypothetical protein